MENLNSFAHFTKQLYSLHKQIDETFAQFGYEPFAGSRASAEIASAIDPEAVKSAYSNASMLIQAASDQFSALIRVITEPALTFAPWSNARGILEASIICIWLLEEGITIKERMARNYAFRVSGLKEQIKYFRVVSQEQMKRAESRLTEVMNKAEKLALTQKDKKGKLELSKQMPSTTDLIRNQINEEGLFRLLSAMTHVGHWAIIGLAFRPVANLPKGKLLEKDINLISIGYLILKSVVVFEKAITCRCRLFGWSFEGIQESFSDMKQAIRVYFPE